MKRRAVALACLLALPAWACEWPGDGQVRIDASTTLGFRFTEGPPRAGEHFGLSLMLCRDGKPWSPDRLRVDAIMPAHNHGMNYRPRIAPDGAGRYGVTGLLLHMPGLWRMRIDYADGDRRGRAEFDIRL